MIPLSKGKNLIYFGVITIILFDDLYRRVYFVMHIFLVIVKILLVLKSMKYLLLDVKQPTIN